MWVLNQSKAVCDVKLHINEAKEETIEDGKQEVAHSDTHEIYEKIKSIMKENNVEEYYIDFI